MASAEKDRYGVCDGKQGSKKGYLEHMATRTRPETREDMSPMLVSAAKDARRRHGALPAYYHENTYYFEASGPWGN